MSARERARGLGRSPRGGAGAEPPLVALGVALLLLAPLVAADHVYSHRYVVDGRLVGSDGLPLPGRVLELVAEEDDFLEVCREGEHVVTDEWGDFEFCYHKHALTPSAKIGVRYGDTTVTKPVDVTFRKATHLLRAPNETGIAPPGWNETYRIAGRAWMPAPQVLEDVQVYGVAVIGLPVNLTVRAPNATPAVFHSTTDAFGDFDLIVEVGQAADTLSLTLEAGGRSQPVQLDDVFHRTIAPVYVSPAGTRVTPQGSPTTTTFDDAPGNTTPRVNVTLVVAVGLGLVAAVVLSRRKAS